MRRREYIAAPSDFIVGCSGSGEVSGGINFIHIDEPDWYVWYQGALVATFLYLPIAPVLAVRAADASVVAALPLVGSTALSSFTLLKGLESVGATGAEFGLRVAAKSSRLLRGTSPKAIAQNALT